MSVRATAARRGILAFEVTRSPGCVLEVVAHFDAGAEGRAGLKRLAQFRDRTWRTRPVHCPRVPSPPKRGVRPLRRRRFGCAQLQAARRCGGPRGERGEADSPWAPPARARGGQCGALWRRVHRPCHGQVREVRHVEPRAALAALAEVQDSRQEVTPVFGRRTPARRCSSSDLVRSHTAPPPSRTSSGARPRAFNSAAAGPWRTTHKIDPTRISASTVLKLARHGQPQPVATLPAPQGCVPRTGMGPISIAPPTPLCFGARTATITCTPQRLAKGNRIEYEIRRFALGTCAYACASTFLPGPRSGTVVPKGLSTEL